MWVTINCSAMPLVIKCNSDASTTTLQQSHKMANRDNRCTTNCTAPLPSFVIEMGSLTKRIPTPFPIHFWRDTWIKSYPATKSIDRSSEWDMGSAVEAPLRACSGSNPMQSGIGAVLGAPGRRLRSGASSDLTRSRKARRIAS